MTIEKIPEVYLSHRQPTPDVFVYDFKMNNDVVKSKVILGMNMVSFLQIGKKQVHFAGRSIAVNKDQSLILKKGNWLWTELLDTDEVYYCKLLFFSENILTSFLAKHRPDLNMPPSEAPYFVIRNDAYIDTYLDSLSTITYDNTTYISRLLSIKFEELMLYLSHKYGPSFDAYLQSLVLQDVSPFRRIVESKIHSNLRLEEIAFLCHMSLSTFKRHFINEYQVSPGKWFKDQRLQRAKEVLEQGNLTPSAIYQEFGYTNLSNFSTAFKNKFGYSPSEERTAS